MLALTLSALTLTLSLDTQNAHARRANIPGEADIKAGNNQAAIDKLSAIEAKDADEYYLLGRAYMNLGKRVEAHKAWTEALHINNELKRGKWKFLFPPNKPLKAKQKSKLKAEFEDEYRALGAAVKRLKTTQARDKVNLAKRTRIDAQKRDAKERQLNKAAAAKGKSIASKQKMADRKSKTQQKFTNTRSKRRTTSSGSPWGFIIFGAIFLIIILAVVFGRRSGGGGRRVTRYEVVYDDHPFDRGPFYYRGSYYRSHDHFYGAHGYYYTNRMYRDNYDRWGAGQRYDEALDDEIHQDIDEREELSMAAAEEGYQADVMRADADHYEQDAHELHQEIQDGDEAAAFFDDDHEFEDDEFSDDEGADESEFGDDEFSDDAHSDYDDGDYGDGGYDDGGYDDGGYDDSEYDDSAYDDGDYDDGGFEDDPGA